jgi:hypothetical protein
LFEYGVNTARRPVFGLNSLFKEKELFIMASDTRTPESAEARQKKKALQAIEGQKAMLEYEQGLRAMRDKTERLRALRLAHEEAEAKKAAEAPPPVKKKTKKAATAKA